MLSTVLRLAGWSAEAAPDPLLLKHVSAMLSGTSVGLAALLAFLIGGRTAMVVTSLLGVFHFGHLVQSATPNAEPLYGVLVVAVLLGALRGINGGALGVLAGAATLVRAEFVLCAALVAIWIAFTSAGERDDLRRSARRRAGVFALGFLLALVPTTIVNWRNISEFNRTRADRMPGPLPRFAPVTSYGPFNFANANHGRAEGGFNWDLPALTSDAAGVADLEQGAFDLARPAVYDTYVRGYGIGAQWIAGNPGQAARLFVNKLAITASVFDYGYLLDNVPVTVRGLRRPVDQIDLPATWLTWLHATLTLAGVWFAARSPDARLLLAPLVTLMASSMLFFGYVRLGVAYLPVIWVMQALAVTRLIEPIRLSPRTTARVERAAAAAIVVLLAIESSRVSPARVVMIDGMADESGRFVEDQPMTIERVR